MTSRPDTPEFDPALSGLETAQPGSTLADGMGGTVDELRQIAVDFGLRPYRVFSVVLKWTGGARGRGEPRVLRETELLPTPLVKSQSLRGEMRSAGRVERGSIKLVEVSPRYTEEDIEVLFPRSLQADEEGFIETRIDGRDGEPRRRRYSIKGTPFRDAENFQWTVGLTPQDDDRDRRGRPKRAGERLP